MEIAPRPITGSRTPLGRRSSTFDDPTFLKRVQPLGVQIQKEGREQGFQRKLTSRQQRFIAEYLIDPKRNATQAAIRAGYSKNVAATVASTDLLQNPRIKKIILEEERKLYSRLDITKEKVLQGVANAAFANILDYVRKQPDGNYEVDIDKLTLQQGIAIQDLKIDTDLNGKTRVSVKLVDKLNALALLGRHLKVFDEVPQNTFISVNFLDKLLEGQTSMSDLPPSQLQGKLIEAVKEETV